MLAVLRPQRHHGNKEGDLERLVPMASEKYVQLGIPNMPLLQEELGAGGSCVVEVRIMR